MSVSLFIKISIQFQHKEVKPGEKTNLLIKAPPMTYVGVVAVDQSVYIQWDKNQLTPSKVSATIATASTTYKSYIV